MFNSTTKTQHTYGTKIATRSKELLIKLNQLSFLTPTLPQQTPGSHTSSPILLIKLISWNNNGSRQTCLASSLWLFHTDYYHHYAGLTTGGEETNEWHGDGDKKITVPHFVRRRGESMCSSELWRYSFYFRVYNTKHLHEVALSSREGEKVLHSLLSIPQSTEREKNYRR